MRQHALRLDDETFAAVDKRAQSVGLSRNSWLTKAIQWALEQPTKERVEKVKI